jgi:uncharacterized phage-associated protein
MSVNTYSAARRICERGDWRVTNLALQKILYLIHMVSLGRTGTLLIPDTFEAWDYGPVVPELYHRVKIFGDRPIQDIFLGSPSIAQTREEEVIDEGCDWLIKKKPAELVAMTHWENGAWASNYVPGARGIPIPTADIIAEYEARIADSD